jgi:hypothetical protein
LTAHWAPDVPRQHFAVEDPKLAEFDLLGRGDPVISAGGQSEPLFAETVNVPGIDRCVAGDDAPLVASIVAVRRLRSVTCLYGFTRLEPAPTFAEQMLEDVRIAVDGAPLAETADWLPAMEQFGEGIFLKIRPQAIRHWLQGQEVEDRGTLLQAGNANYAARDQMKQQFRGCLMFFYIPCRTRSRKKSRSIAAIRLARSRCRTTIAMAGRIASFGNAPQPAGRSLIQMFPNQSFCQALPLQRAMASIPPSDRLRGRRPSFLRGDSRWMEIMILQGLALRVGADRTEHHGVRDFATPDLQPTLDGPQEPGGIAARIFGLKPLKQLTASLPRLRRKPCVQFGASDCHSRPASSSHIWNSILPYLCGDVSGVAAVRLGVTVAWAASASVTTPAALPSRSILSAPATKQPRYMPLRQ